MDRAYEGEIVRAAAREQGFEPVVPPKKNRRNPWEYDKERYKRRNGDLRKTMCKRQEKTA